MKAIGEMNWKAWSKFAPHRQAESIYYILSIPMGWSGPPPGSHRYSGLHFKIGRSKDVLARAKSLRTGTSDELIIHAMKPGSSEIESKLHRLFQSDRRQGEWFAASPSLSQHVYDVWKKNLILPPEHQKKLLTFAEKNRIFADLRAGGANYDVEEARAGYPQAGFCEERALRGVRLLDNRMKRCGKDLFLGLRLAADPKHYVAMNLFTKGEKYATRSLNSYLH